MRRGVAMVPAVVAVVSCAKASNGPGPIDAPAVPADIAIDSCGSNCDTDMDGVRDGSDQCPNTPPGQVVNKVGCADSQLTPVLVAGFPPFGLTWTNTGNLGRAGGLTWTYTGIARADLFHIYWIVCDDPATPCGLSLDGPIDATAAWTFSAASSNLAGGTLVFTNATHIVHADNTTVPLTGRLTLTLVDGSNAPLPFATVGALGVPARTGTYGAEIPGTAYAVKAIAEVQESGSATWTPYLDYYDAAPTSMTGSGTAVSYGASFYDK
ncbi:MAG: hypothetical protein JO257_36360 [Deltaproteobacteria bacterium]|nr:hypothetical protein [Deltaproteobacteria bacterium]